MKSMILVFLVTFSFLLQASAQDVRPYDGGYTFNGLRGNGKFTYYLTPENDPVLQGPFQFTYKKLDSLTKEDLKKLEAKGYFKDYKKDKSWSYLLENHQIQIEDVRGRDLIARLESKLSELNASYDQGQLQGKWNYTEKNWLNEQFLETFRTGDLIFSKDKLTGAVQFENLTPTEPYRINGSLTEEGLMDGAWEFRYQENGIPVQEIRRYEKGFLIGLQKTNEITSEKLDEVVFFNAIEKLDSLDQGFNVDYSLSDRFFGLTFNDGFGQQSQEFRQQYQGTQLLEDALKRVLQFEDEEFVKEGRLIKSPIQTRRFRYELGKTEQDAYQRSLEIFEQLKSSLELAISSRFLELNGQSSDSLAFAKAYFAQLKSKLQELEPVMEVIKSGEIAYFDPLFYQKNELRILPDSDTLQINIDSKKEFQVLSYPKIEEEASFGAGLFKYLNVELKNFTVFDQFLTKQKQTARQNLDLVSIENLILAQKKRLDSTYQNLTFSSEKHRLLVTQVYTNLAEVDYKNRLAAFNTEKTFEGKATIGDELVDLLRFLNSNLSDLERIARLETELTELFTEKTFDPFTFETEFEVIRQKILYQTGLSLMTYERNKLIQTTDYQEAERRLLNLENLLIQLTKLRKSDTRKLERDLQRAAGDINQLKKLLSI